MRRAAVVALMVLAAAALAGDRRIVVGAFSEGSLAGWEAKRFAGETEYRIEQAGGRRALCAQSEGAASGLYRRKTIDLTQTPYLEWSWRVAGTLGEIDETRRAGDDYAARVYVVFSGGVLFWRTRAIDYVWASGQPRGATWRNAFTDQVWMVALRSGDARAGTWVSERRDVRADYRRLYGEDVAEADAVAIMTDTDNAGGTVRACYGDIAFTAGTVKGASSHGR